MTNVGTIIAGYGITILSLGFYAAWIVVRGREIGNELGIGATVDAGTGLHADTEESSPWT
ncbi:MAG: hypothetical protein P8N02_05185 [Actinomycetota bacterium]|jgi:hypothetical protein|nr:hypothetical protein [Actinomycetota bacterium]